MSFEDEYREEKYALQVRKALEIMGYDTHTIIRNGKTCILPGEARQAAQKLQARNLPDRER